MEAFMQTAAKVHLDGILDRVKVPFLVTHGENDRQIPIEYAHQTFDQLTNSPKKDLIIFTAENRGSNILASTMSPTLGTLSQIGSRKRLER